MSALGRLLALPPSRRRLLYRAAVVVALFRAGLSILPFRWVRALAERPRPRPRAPRATPDELAWSVGVSGRRIGSTCLTEALALQALLLREGHEATLRLGVAKTEAGALEAHAWLESRGRVLIGGPESARFTPLPLPNAAHPPA
jgi:hypothetical protein